MKHCRVCKEIKNLEDFHRRSSSKDGRQSICRICNNAKATQWQKDNPERYEANWRRNKRTPEQLLARRAEKYGLSIEELTVMMTESGGVCNICQRMPVKFLVIDHCHSQGHVRGLLCEKCNTALGLFDDNVEWMLAAVAYLNKQ